MSPQRNEGAGAPDVDELWSRFSEDLYRFIARRARRPEDAEDIRQSVFLRIHRGVGELRDEDRVVGWIYTLTRNAITDYYRLASNRREVAVDELPTALHPLEDEEEVNTAEAELATCLRPMLTRLPRDQAAALELVELGGLSQVEAARRAGVSVSGMKSRVQRGRSRLRAVMLDCCSVTTDVRGTVTEFAPHQGACGGCA